MLMYNNGIEDIQDITFNKNKKNKIYIFMDPLFESEGEMSLISSTVPITNRTQHNLVWEINPESKSILKIDFDKDGLFDKEYLLKDMIEAIDNYE